MIFTQVKTCGASTYWSLCRWTHHQKLKDELNAIGWGDYAPPPRPATVALKDALLEVCADSRHFVRPTDDRYAFAVVEENRGTQLNRYDQTLLARIDPATMQIAFTPFHAQIADQVVTSFNEHLGLLSAGNVSNALVRITLAMNGTTLRESGGLYWLPEDMLPAWKRIAHAVEGCAAKGGGSRIAILRSAMDEDAMRAIRDAIQAEILGAATALNEEVLGGELGERALKSRKEDCTHLKQKIQQYEEILGQSLAHLTQAIQTVEIAAGMAALQVSAGAA